METKETKMINERGEEVQDTQRELTESIKLIKNSKGYNWEIRLHIPKFENPNDQETADKHTINRLETISEELKKRFELWLSD